MKDLSTVERTLTKNVETLLREPNFDRMEYQEIKQRFFEILESKNTSVSHATKMKWYGMANTARTKCQLIQGLINLYLAGSNLAMPSLRKK
jgi:hypothetical protein